MNNSVSYLTLFKTFMKIGIVTFGGGYAMIPIIESEVVDKHHWMTKEEFLDAIDHVMHDPKWRKDASKRSEEIASAFDKKNFGDAIENIYESVL